MNTRLTILVLLVAAMLAGGAGGTPVAIPDSSPPTIAQLKKQNRQLRLDNADLQDEVDAQDGVISDQADTIQRLRTRLANQPDPLEAITSRDPDGLWMAMLAIWRAFPTLAPGELCGYDKNTVPGDTLGLTLTSFTFYRWSGC